MPNTLPVQIIEDSTYIPAPAVPVYAESARLYSFRYTLHRDALGACFAQDRDSVDGFGIRGPHPGLARNPETGEMPFVEDDGTKRWRGWRHSTASHHHTVAEELLPIVCDAADALPASQLPSMDNIWEAVADDHLASQLTITLPRALAIITGNGIVPVRAISLFNRDDGPRVVAHGEGVLHVDSPKSAASDQVDPEYFLYSKHQHMLWDMYVGGAIQANPTLVAIAAFEQPRNEVEQTILCLLVAYMRLCQAPHLQEQAVPAVTQQHSQNVPRGDVRVLNIHPEKSWARTADGTAEKVERTSRWYVRGHWRNQWHPSTGTHEPQWIWAHIKGNPDAPLKPRAQTVFRLNR